MFKSIRMLGVCLLTFLVLVSACGNQSNDDSADDKKTGESTTMPSDNDSSDGNSSEDNSTTTTSSSKKVFIDYATEEFLGKFHSYNEFVAEDGESIVFWSENSISNFNFIEIGYEMEGDNFSYFQAGILYSIDELSPEKPVVIRTLISEGIPNRGISYTDGNGKERYFYIAWSGFDDSLSLVEFENQKSDNNSSSSSSTELSDERADRVLDAALKLLSKEGYTVDFATRTATLDGKNVPIEVVEMKPDFKEGHIAEKVDDGNVESHNHTLYSFRFDDNNKLTLLEPGTEEVVYSE